MHKITISIGAKCDAFQDYAEACREAGKPVDWRDDAKCRVDCPPGSSYNYAHGDTEETCEGTRAVASEGQTAEGKFVIHILFNSLWIREIHFEWL